jgi:desert hedgehog
MVAYTCTTTCFPGISTVELASGGFKLMSDLRIGDSVRVGKTEFSDVFLFSHRMESVNASFLRITAESESSQHTVHLTTDHYLYVNGKLMIAAQVQAGDSLISSSGVATVTKVTTVVLPGLYNPHTLTGDIFVDGILTSTYTAAIAPTLAHTLLWPVRAMYSLGFNVSALSHEEGSSMLAAIAPQGRDVY